MRASQITDDMFVRNILYEEVTAPQAVQAGSRSSLRATLARLAYVAAISAAMFGWLYLLWLALVSSVQGRA